MDSEISLEEATSKKKGERQIMFIKPFELENEFIINSNRGFIYACTRTNAQPIYIYDVSDLDDTATGYAGLEPAWREG
ncbi:hypothetical protein ALC53_03666 [Atta colombica]|uniref:Uncharacterized protein n=1 Tax=Atta colombica TaxID=520822 RepID=A0A195BNW3_9HYME|nr:hypothetical protein ALC53_03666 [Atta colombica]